MYNMMTIDNPATKYIGKLKRVNCRSSHHKKKILPLFFSSSL